ncbi:PDGLE domain-containing protein [Candidatus Pyrohabitans sp.]
MRLERRYFIALGIVFMIAVLAPFLASPNPDGLESTAEKFESAHNKEVALFSSPFPDYSIPGIPGAASEVAAMLIGTALIFAIGFGAAKALTKAG